MFIYVCCKVPTYVRTTFESVMGIKSLGSLPFSSSISVHQQTHCCAGRKCTFVYITFQSCPPTFHPTVAVTTYIRMYVCMNVCIVCTY